MIAFTSGTTGEPKGTMHFHRDMLAICDTYGKHVLRPRADDLFIGSPPIAFTFGLGGIVLFPLRVGAATLLIEQPSPDAMLEAIRTQRPDASASPRPPPIAPCSAGCSRAMPPRCGSASPPARRCRRRPWQAWQRATGIKILDGIGSTEMLHIFIGAPVEAIRPGATGLPVPGYEAKLIDEDGNDLPRGSVGRLAVRGPTGCRYLADPRQTRYVQNGWNFTGDTYRQDEDGYFWFQARSDDMIVSAGLQHRRPRGGGGADHPSGGRRNAAWWRRPTRSAATSSRPMSCCATPPAPHPSSRGRCRTT